LKKKQAYHSKLKRDDIVLVYNNRVHAKLLVVDRAVAVVSSMNFYPDSSAGASWETGVITLDMNVINSILQSVLARLI
jgi:phosphatidylserine/phosphatidylglycerophosphate/cardiolipin synthase-like enzyme